MTGHPARIILRCPSKRSVPGDERGENDSASPKNAPRFSNSLLPFRLRLKVIQRPQQENNKKSRVLNPIETNCVPPHVTRHVHLGLQGLFFGIIEGLLG